MKLVTKSYVVKIYKLNCIDVEFINRVDQAMENANET